MGEGEMGEGKRKGGGRGERPEGERKIVREERGGKVNGRISRE